MSEHVPLTREAADRALRACTNQESGCDPDSPVFLHAVCHPFSPTWTTYDWRTGTIAVYCAFCGRYVVSFGLEGVGQSR